MFMNTLGSKIGTHRLTSHLKKYIPRLYSFYTTLKKLNSKNSNINLIIDWIEYNENNWLLLLLIGWTYFNSRIIFCVDTWNFQNMYRDRNVIYSNFDISISTILHPTHLLFFAVTLIFKIQVIAVLVLFLLYVNISR